MTITANDARKQTTATGGETSVAYDFLITDEDHLVVTRTRSGTDTVLAITTDYTVTGVDNDAGGTAELVVAAVAADVYTCERLVPQARTTDFADGGDFLADTVNDELDRIVSMIQEVARDVGRSLRLTDTDPTAGSNVKLGPVSSRASKYFAFDASGVPTFTSGTENAFVVSSFAETFLDDVDAEAARTTLGVMPYSKTTVSPTSDPYEITDVPSWAEKVTIIFRGLTHSGSDGAFELQLGHAGGYITSYVGNYSKFASNTVSSGAHSSLIYLTPQGPVLVAGEALNGVVTLHKAGGNYWVFEVNTTAETSANTHIVAAGSVDMTAALTKFKVDISTNGINGGTITYIYEGTQ